MKILFAVLSVIGLVAAAWKRRPPHESYVEMDAERLYDFAMREQKERL